MLLKITQFSPRTRGCSCVPCPPRCRGRVFPAHAGMFRGKVWRRQAPGRFPRARGDVPAVAPSGTRMLMFSPRTRGCSWFSKHWPQAQMVFPAHAGMFLKSDAYQAVAIRFPRARGDVPEGESLWLSIIKFSPRTRGCSDVNGKATSPYRVFPAHAGMFRYRK